MLEEVSPDTEGTWLTSPDQTSFLIMSDKNEMHRRRFLAVYKIVPKKLRSLEKGERSSFFFNYLRNCF